MTYKESVFRNKTVLVSGGAGSIGSAVVKKLVEFDVHSIRVLDNNEYALFKMKRSLENPKLRLLLGDIRDRERVEMAVDGVDIILHFAAVKNIEISEYNPIEAIKTNVDGTINLIEASLKSRPERFLYISSDKAVSYTSLYGATKFLGEKLTIWANKIQDRTLFSCARLGNVYESRGNVFELWDEQKARGEPLTLTHPDMRRFFMHLDEATHFIISAVEMMKGGEIFVPQMKEEQILELAKKLYGNNIKFIGPRPGEKIREELMTPEERKIAKEENGIWVIRND